jgi:prepilin-type N-terminal cleavage/methylation domain-containing protein
MTRRAFTLIELLVVMAISALLLVIIAVPVVQGFNLTRFAQGFADAQDRGRTLVRRLEREIGNAAGVRDNSGIRGALNVVVPGQNGAPEPVLLQGVKMDLLKPAEGDPTRGPSGAFINPDTGKEDPTLQAPKGQVNLPAVPGLTIVRYFVGLRDPFRTYFNGYDGLLMPRDGGRDNLFVLFRAEVQPYIWVNVNGQQRRVVNAAYFFDQDYDNDPNTSGPLLDDPDFFRTDVPIRAYAQVPPGWRQPGAPDKATMVLNWVSRSVVQTEVSRYDMIAPVFDRVSRRVVYDGNVPRLVSMVRFQPTRVTSEPAESQTAVRTGEEGDNSIKYGPDVYRTQFGAWSNLLMRVWPSEYPTNWGPGAGQSDAGDLRARWGGGNLINGSPPYLVARTWTDGAGIERFSVFGYDPNTASGPDTSDGIELFDVSRYLEVRRIDTGFTPRPYAFTEAVNVANVRSGWLASALWRENFVPSVPDPKSGKVLTAFDSREVGTDATVPFDLRVPTFGQQTAPANLRFGVRVSPYDAAQPLDYNPNNDPDAATGNWYDAIFEPVNRKFNKLWRDFPTLAPGLSRDQYVKRYIDLRTCPQPDGAFGPTSGPVRTTVARCATPA